MPINYKDYNKDWKEISKTVIANAKNNCELCFARNHEPHWLTESTVVLTVHHIDFDKTNNTRVNLIALCQRCHLRLDLGLHLKNRKINKNKNQKDLFK